MRELVAGVDEAGRGPLAGPVIAAAVILDSGAPIVGLTDSKLLSPKQREALEAEIRDKSVGWSVAAATPAEVDRHNIHHATLLAMRRAVLGLRRLPDRVVVDGRFLPNLPCPGEATVGADRLVQSVSAASVIAKTFRDRYMIALAREYAGYGFDQHKGYPTRDHLAALDRQGVCPAHRRSFRPVYEHLQAAPHDV